MSAQVPTWRRVPWLKILRVVGMMCAAVIIAMGIYQLVTDDPEFKPIIADVYRIIFGILILLAELQVVRLLTWFSFLCTLIGLGGFYIFVGGLALGGEWWAITLAVIMVLIGMVYCMAGCACQDDRPKAVALANGQDVQARGWKDPDTGIVAGEGGVNA